LTGLLAPESFFARFTAELDRCGALGHNAILVICDLDQFGELNRTAGLVDANRLLRGVADCFRLTVREGDLLGRLGGDEFALCFPGLPPEIAESRIRDLRAAVREAASLTLAEESHRVTISVGMSCFPRDGQTGEELIEVADLALQAAKQQRAAHADQPMRSAMVVSRS
jgi:diguanylate cyclase (GGDEF)-like protein